MTLNVTLTRPSGSGKTFSDDIAPGIYSGQIIKVEETEKKKYQSEEMEQAIKFVIKLNNGIFAQHITSTSLAEKPNKSKLFRLIESLNPGAVSSGQLAKDETALAVIEGLKGRSCQIQVGQRTTDSGVYPTIESIFPVTSNGNGAQPSYHDEPTTVDALEVEAADDDIPF